MEVKLKKSLVSNKGERAIVGHGWFRLLLAISLTTTATVFADNFTSLSHLTPAPGAPQRLTRRVQGQKLISTQLPAVQIKFDKGFKYAGGQLFLLYEVALAEQHFFVDADKTGRIRRLYWIQFEGYVSNNAYTYHYDSTKTVDIGGLTFVADAFARSVQANTGRAESDGSRAQAFLKSKGYRMNSEILMQRLVHLVDEAKRNELMIIYMEDLSGTGLTAADLGKNGAAAARWDEISKGLLIRAVRGITISTN